jgi:hypothetical protein
MTAPGGLPVRRIRERPYGAPATTKDEMLVSLASAPRQPGEEGLPSRPSKPQKGPCPQDLRRSCGHGIVRLRRPTLSKLSILKVPGAVKCGTANRSVPLQRRGGKEDLYDQAITWTPEEDAAQPAAGCLPDDRTAQAAAPYPASNRTAQAATVCPAARYPETATARLTAPRIPIGMGLIRTRCPARSPRERRPHICGGMLAETPLLAPTAAWLPMQQRSTAYALPMPSVSVSALFCAPRAWWLVSMRPRVGPRPEARRRVACAGVRIKKDEEQQR